jgi:hypothetical protein
VRHLVRAVPPGQPVPALPVLPALAGSRCIATLPRLNRYTVMLSFDSPYSILSKRE